MYYSYEDISRKWLKDKKLNPVEKFIHRWMPDPDKPDSVWLNDFNNALKFYAKQRKYSTEAINRLLEYLEVDNEEDAEIIVGLLTNGDWFVTSLYNEISEEIDGNDKS